MAQWWSLISPGGALLRVFGLPQELQCPGTVESERPADLLIVAMVIFHHSLLTFKAFALASTLEGARAFFFNFDVISVKKLTESYFGGGGSKFLSSFYIL